MGNYAKNGDSRGMVVLPSTSTAPTTMEAMLDLNTICEKTIRHLERIESQEESQRAVSGIYLTVYLWSRQITASEETA